MSKCNLIINGKIYNENKNNMVDNRIYYSLKQLCELLEGNFDFEIFYSLLNNMHIKIILKANGKKYISKCYGEDFYQDFIECVADIVSKMKAFNYFNIDFDDKYNNINRIKKHLNHLMSIHIDSDDYESKKQYLEDFRNLISRIDLLKVEYSIVKKKSHKM